MRLIREVLEEQFRQRQQQQHCVSTCSFVVPAEDQDDQHFLRLAMLSYSLSAEATDRAIAQGAADQAFILLDS